MPENGFTATFISNTGKTFRQFNIIGWKLFLVRFLMALFVLLVSASSIIIAYGLINAGETAKLREEISQLRDSLTVRRNIETRLESMEYELQQLHEFRQRLENITSLISAPQDSLE